ncbi:hypothetical protein [Paenibacillus albus]|uniref:YhfM-like domain-containing protein n=1 Tax=Paenibacillus albus TaxID=2495582 RepID=A0A3Q8X8J9_9BACL|nr:hypothetical protein [Paenibacillus albus]AZN42628.1 hypothetical protein EJC50_25260 [Paenibacillus albus]
MRFLMFVLLFAVVFAVTGCTHEKIQQISFNKMKSFKEMEQNSLKVISDTDDISVFSKAFKYAKKNAGIADMADPQYKVKLGKETYFLWITEEAGTIENVNNTNTTYSISKKSAGEVYQLIMSYYFRV